MKLYIIIPAYNEEKRISKTLESYLEFFKKIKKENKLDFNILVVINNTKDKTKIIVENYCKKYSELSYLDLEKGGKGYAVIEGFKYALKKDFDLIGYVDADLATPPEAFYMLVERIKNYDGIIASRWNKKSIIKTPQTLLRKITSRGFNFLVRILFFMPYNDTQCGAKLFKKEAIKNVVNKIGITKWAFDIDLLYNLKKSDYKIIESPTIWEDKTDSKLNLKTVPLMMFLSIVRLRILNSPFKKIVDIYDKIPEKIKIHHRWI